MDTRTGQSVELLGTLIRNQCVNDGTPESGGEVRYADVLQSVLEAARVTCNGSWLTGRTPIRDAPSLSRMSHLDVVPVDVDAWTHDPFRGELIDGEVWVRGAVDMLNLGASMAVAYAELAHRGFVPRGDFLFFAAADEESGSTYGARWVADNARDAITAEYVLTESGGVRR